MSNEHNLKNDLEIEADVPSLPPPACPLLSGPHGRLAEKKLVCVLSCGWQTGQRAFVGAQAWVRKAGSQLLGLCPHLPWRLRLWCLPPTQYFGEQARAGQVWAGGAAWPRAPMGGVGRGCSVQVGRASEHPWGWAGVRVEGPGSSLATRRRPGSAEVRGRPQPPSGCRCAARGGFS